MLIFHSRTSVFIRQTFRVIIILLVAGNSLAKAQAWMRYIKPERVNTSSLKNGSDTLEEVQDINEYYNFYDIEDAFNKYWKNKQVEKGKGYKQFRRWEYFMKQRVNPAGNFDLIAYQNAVRNFELEAGNDTLFKPVWNYIGPVETPLIKGSVNHSGNGRINCVAFHPVDTFTLLAGAPSGGIWKSTDGGQSWKTTTDKLLSIGISDIVYDYDHPDTIYAVTGDGDNYHTYSIGVIKSVDGGETWTITNFINELSETQILTRIIMHPTKPLTMFLSSSKGIYRTDDGWETFVEVIEGHFQDLEFKPGQPDTIYASMYNYYGNGKVYRSVDGGVNFTEIMNGFNTENNVNRIELAVTPDNPERIYALASRADDDGFFGFFSSDNSGNTWSLKYSKDIRNLLGWTVRGTDKGGQGWYDLSLAVSPENEDDIYMGGVNIWESHNGGIGWVITTYWQPENSELSDKTIPYVHADHHMLKYNPYNNDLYSCNDGGLYFTSDNGDTWTDISTNLEILQVYRISNAYQDSLKMLVGNQDNGTFLKTDSIFNEVLSGDGMNCIVDYSDTNTMYASIYEGTIFRSDDGGKTFSHIVPDNYPKGAWITPFEQHPHIPVILYAGYQDIYKSSNKGESWSRITNNLVTNEDEYLTILKIAPSNNEFIYVATDSIIWKSEDDGNSWSEIGDILPDPTITDIEIAENDPNKLWVSFSGFNSVSKVYYSNDGGITWYNISQGLPNVPVNCLEYLNGSDKGIFAGTDLGVFFRDASMSTWKNFRGNLPNVIVNELEIYNPAKKLRAGTFGRGIWETALSDTISPLKFDFEANILKPCVGAEVNFRLLGTESYDSVRWDFGENTTVVENLQDTLLKVTFLFPGLYSVELNVYKDSVMYTESKVNYIKAVPYIDFNVYPSLIVACDIDTTMLYVNSEFEYTWDPDEDLQHIDNTRTLAFPSQPVAYTITGSHGSCTLQRKVLFSETPDSVCDALYLPLGEYGPISNECATVEAGEPIPPEGTGVNLGCNSEDGWCIGDATIENTVWFKTVMPESGEMSIVTSGFDNQIAVYSANSCESLLNNDYQLIAANDDYVESAFNAAALKRIETPSPGDTLWIQIDGGVKGEKGWFSLELNPFIIVGIGKVPVSRIENLRIFPNPSNGMINIQVPEFPYEKGIIEIYNSEGKFILRKETYGMNNNIIEINTHLDPGLYFLRLRIKDKVFIGKIIMQ